jgi:hypothetical protein
LKADRRRVVASLHNRQSAKDWNAVTRMLPATTFSTISGASTSLSGDVEFEIVEQIIERAPRSATCWPQVYRAYGEVLEEK